MFDLRCDLGQQRPHQIILRTGSLCGLEFNSGHLRGLLRPMGGAGAVVIVADGDDGAGHAAAFRSSAR